MINFKQWCQNWRIIRQLRTQICGLSEALSEVKRKEQDKYALLTDRQHGRAQHYQLRAKRAANELEDIRRVQRKVAAAQTKEIERLKAQLLTYSDYVKTHIDKEVVRVAIEQAKEEK